MSANPNTLTDQHVDDAVADIKAAMATKGATATGAPAGPSLTDDELKDCVRQGVAAVQANPVGKFDINQIIQLMTTLLPIILALFQKKNPAPTPTP